MVFISILADGDEATESIKTFFFFPKDFLKLTVECLSQISSDRDEFPAASHISKIVYFMT